MRSRFLLAVLCCCAALLTLPAEAQITLPDDNCYAVCTSTTPCNQWCVDREHDPWAVIFCGDYGVCDPSTGLVAGGTPSVESAAGGDHVPVLFAAPVSTGAPAHSAAAAAEWPECTYDRDCEWACPQGGRCDAGGCLCKDALQ